MQNVFGSYSGTIWQTIYQALSYYMDQLAAATDPATVTAMSNAMLESLLNGIDAINANNMVYSWNSAANGLQEIQTLPLTLNPASLYTLLSRTDSYISAALALNALLPQPPFQGAAQTIGSGTPIVPDMGLLAFYENFNYETPPSGVAAASLIAYASGVATNFTAIANAIIAFQGASPNQLYDFATRESACANAATYILQQITSSPFSAAALSVSGLWNELAVLPAMTMSASIISTPPFLYQNQQSACIRYAMLSLAAQVENFLLILRKPQSTIVNLTTLRNGESLMDVAARALGNFELWTEIATLNNLTPPYTGPLSVSGIAGWGTQLILPSPGTQQSATGLPPSYEINFLGTDVYVGPINGSMPVWSGDFQVISGYNNLAWALGRRLQTTLSALIYHPDYGSRIPPQVGAVQATQTPQRIAAFGKSALFSDPRVSKILAAVAALQSNGKVAFQGTVLPAGFGALPTEINEVISPLP
jgi:hypothetical protein